MRAFALAAVAAAAVTFAPAAAPAGSPSTSSGPSVRAVVVVRPGVTLPLKVAGGRVLSVFSHLGSELVTAPLSSLRRLAAASRVAGMSPDRTGRVAGSGTYTGPGVLAPSWLGGTAGRHGTGYHVNVALLDTGVTDTAALNRASGRITDGVDVSKLASGGVAL